jgi:hypothetical protein
MKITVKEAELYIEKNRDLLRQMREYEDQRPEPEMELGEEDYETLELYYRLKVFAALQKYERLVEREKEKSNL